MPTAITQEENKQGGSTALESLKNHPHSEEDGVVLPEMQQMNAKQQKEWASKNEERMEKAEKEAADA